MSDQNPPTGQDTPTGTDPDATYDEPGYEDKSMGQAGNEDQELAERLLRESGGDAEEAAAQVVVHRQRDENRQEHEACERRHLRELGRVLHVHEEQDDEHRLAHGNGEGHRQVQHAEVDACDGHREDGEHHQRGEDGVVQRLRSYMA